MLLISGGITILCIWTAILLVILGTLIYANIKLFYYLVQRNKLAKAHILMVKTETERKYNKIATMPPNDLEAYLSKIFAISVARASDTDVSDNDPDAASKLFFKTSERLINYLGPETVEAIEYYYGKDYIIRWCEMNYMNLTRNGVLAKIIKTGATTANPEIEINQSNE